MKKIVNIILIIVFLATIGYFGYNYYLSKDAYYLTISINPEIKLVINRKNIVTEALPVNEDADIILSDLKLVGLNIDLANEKIVEAAEDTGFIDEYSAENTIIITAMSDNEQERKEFEERIMSKLERHFESKKIYPILIAKSLGDELKEEAEEYNISNGKMLLVEEAMALDSSLNKAELVEKSVQDIQKIIKENITKNKEETKEIKQKLIEKKNELKLEYKNKIIDLKESILKIKKSEFKNMSEEQKEEAINSYLEEKKEILKSKKENIINEIRKDKNKSNSNSNYDLSEENVNVIREEIIDKIQQMEE
ncbi:MAG TPA: hypothetical protein PKY25_03060 [Bacilli bacterium]|nr:hypothetical protein [Bacilli bacterium]